MARRTKKKQARRRSAEPAPSAGREPRAEQSAKGDSFRLESASPSAGASPPAIAPEEAARRAQRAETLFRGAAVLAVIWVAALAGLALFAANPVTLNRAQIERADYVVTATLSADQSGTIEVEKEWKRGTALGTVAVENLEQAGARPGTKYLMPLTGTADDRFRVTPSPLPNEAPLIYPDTPEARDQLADLLHRPAIHPGP